MEKEIDNRFMPSENIFYRKAVEAGLAILSGSKEIIQRKALKEVILEGIIRLFDTDLVELFIREEDSPYYWKADRLQNGTVICRKYTDAENLAHYEKIWVNLKKDDRKFYINDSNPSVYILQIRFLIENTGVGGMLFIHSGMFPANEVVEAAGMLADIIGVALSYRNTQWKLRERIKELTCLFRMAKLLYGPHTELETILKKVIEIIPVAFQYPSAAVARIRLDGITYEEKTAPDILDSITSAIVVGGKCRGEIEVSYLSNPVLDQEMKLFLIEEQRLLDSISDQLSMIISDIKRTEDKNKLEEQLRHADRLATIGQLSAGVAHELNEPLGSILGFAELMNKDIDLNVSSKKDLEKIINAAKHAREIVRKMLIFGRQVSTSVSRVDLNQIVKEGISFFESRCRRSSIEIYTDFQEDLPFMYIDPSHLTQIVINLSVNAVQAMEMGGVLSLKTWKLENEIGLQISDTGTGIAREDMEKIFLPFFTTKDIGEGTGLGLAVVHGLVTTYNGRIEFESELNKGTVFRVYLPLVSAGNSG